MLRLALSCTLVLAACGPKAVAPKPVEPVVEAPKSIWKAYPRVDITDGGWLIMPSDLGMNPDAQGALTAAGVPADQVATVIAGTEDAAWPRLFADPDARYNNYLELGLMRARQVAYLEPDQVVLAILADENQHLKPEARPTQDFFAVFIEWGVMPIDPVAARPGTQLDASRYDAVKIVDPDRVFAYSGLRYIERSTEILMAAGVPEKALESLFNRSEQNSWPRGLRDDRRAAHAADISKYKARRIAELNRNVLLLISAAENQHMPGALAPGMDFYVLVDPAGVSKQ